MLKFFERLYRDCDSLPTENIEIQIVGLRGCCLN